MIPITGTISVVGRTVQYIGATLFYTTSVGVKIVSPTVEAGFLSALSLLNLSGTGVTYVVGGGTGVINQVGMSAVGAGVGVTKSLASGAIDTAKLVTFVSYDFAKASSKIIINEASSGVVLGYNALLALPTHTLLATTDAVFFLAWDGPRLVIAMAKGEIVDTQLNSLPVGSVVDLKKLQEEGIEIEVISKEIPVIEKVLHQMPHDLKVK
jgi:hypothetical protein